MTTKTRLELIIEALDQLNIIVPGQAPSSTIINKMDEVFDPVVEMLDGLGIYYVDDPGEVGPTDGNIESAAFLPLGAYLANAAASKFNLPADAKLKALAIEAEQTLRTLSRPASTRKFLKTDAGIPTSRNRYRRWDLGSL
jgi:hypothetical protein